MTQDEFFDHFMRRIMLRTSANELADSMVEHFSDDEIIEFFCWCFDRLGMKHDRDAVAMLDRLSESFKDAYGKVDETEYNLADDLCNSLKESADEADDEPCDEWDFTDAPDMSELWDSLLDNDESEE